MSHPELIGAAKRPGSWSRGAAVLVALAVLFLASAASGATARNAYVTDESSNTVSVIDTATNQVVGEPIKVGEGPREVAITPDGTRAYVSNRISKDIYVIDTATNQVVGEPIKIGDDAVAIAISPDGRRAYVARLNLESVSVIDTATDQVIGEPIKVGKQPRGIAFTPDGSRAYVTNKGSQTVSVIDTATDQVVAGPIEVGNAPRNVAITPDGAHAYVTNASSGTVSVIATATNAVVGEPIGLEVGLSGIAITPDGTRAYVTDETSNTVSVIDTATNRMIGGPIKVGLDPRSVTIAPDGSRAYVANQSSGDVSVIDTATNQVIGSPVKVGEGPFGIAIPPNQPPLASFRALRARPGVPVVFNASASSDPDDRISAFAWSFGDRRVSRVSSPKASHTYAKPGTYPVTLNLTDDEGCSTSLIFTGQVAFCNGGKSAKMTQRVTVAYPGVRVACPRGARPPGCRFTLQVIARKPKPGRRAKTESAVARTRVRPGRSAIVSLKPTARHRGGLARARSVLVEETETIGGLRRVRYRRLKIVR